MPDNKTEKELYAGRDITVALLEFRQRNLFS